MRLMRIGDRDAETPRRRRRRPTLRPQRRRHRHRPDVLGGRPSRRIAAALEAGTLPEIDISGRRIGAPIARPSAVICIGQNYAAHAAESGAAAPTQPIIFLKTPNTITGPYDPIGIPPRATTFDWEVELGVVIGARAAYLESPEAAAEVIGGYLVANDLSERDYQTVHSGGQWSKGKVVKDSMPLGPCLVTADAIDPHRLRLASWVNGEPRQDSNTSDMIFPVEDIVWRLSQYMRLEPGDVISTGTPQGRRPLRPLPLPRTRGCLRGRDRGTRSTAAGLLPGRRSRRDRRRPPPRLTGRRPSACDVDLHHPTPERKPHSMSTISEFAGLTALVTGGASGIGRAVTELLLDGGANVAVLDLNPAGAPDGALGLACDVSDRASVAAAVEAAAAEFGGIDIVVNNAGIGAQGQVDANDDAEWERVLSVNVVSVARVTAAALPYLRRSEHAADRQHLVGRRHCGTARPCPLLGEQGSDLLDDAGHGRRPRP